MEFYNKMCMEDYKKMTFYDFMEVCNTLKLPVFEVKMTINPFAEPHRSVEPKMYLDIMDFRKSMPDWSARNYDFANDRAAAFYEIKEIPTGDFIVRADNNHSIYEWHFQVLDGCVVVHTKYNITD